MENREAKFIREMISLVESINDKLEKSVDEDINIDSSEDGKEQNIDEQVTKVAQQGFEAIANILKSEKGLFSTLKNEIPALSRFKTADELLIAAKKAPGEMGALTTAEKFMVIKQANKVPEIALKLKGLIGESPAFKEILKKVYPKGGAMPANPENFKLASETLQKTYGMSAKEAEALLQKGASEMRSTGGVSSKAVDKAINRRIKKTGGGEITLPKPPPVPPPPIPRPWYIKIIIWIKQGKSWKDILKWGLAGGLTAAALWWMMADSGETVPEDFPPTPPNPDSEWAPCIQELINKKEGVVGTSSSGQVSVFVKSSEYPAGLNFYSNGRVMNSGTGKMGSWKCKTGGGAPPTIVQEDLNEASAGNIDSDVERMIDLLDFPVSGSDLQSALGLLQKYASSAQGKEFLKLYQASGLGGGSLRKSLDYIYTVNASSVRAKQMMYQLIDQIESGKGGGGGTSTGLGGIEITWDGEPVPGPTENPVPGPTKNPVPGPTKEPVPYKDCKDFPFDFGCRNEKISEIQACLDLPSQRGYFGPKTLAKLKEEIITKRGLKMSIDPITKELYDYIKKEICGKNPVTPGPGPTPQPTPSGGVTPGPTPTPIPPPPTPIKPVYDENRLQELLASEKLIKRKRWPKRGLAAIWRGPKLSGNDFYILNKYLEDKGYVQTKQTDKGDGDDMKYKWINTKSD